MEVVTTKITLAGLPEDEQGRIMPYQWAQQMMSVAPVRAHVFEASGEEPPYLIVEGHQNVVEKVVNAFFLFAKFSGGVVQEIMRDGKPVDELVN